MSDKEKNRLEWKERIKQFRESNISMQKWCDANGFKVHQLQYWLRKYNNNSELPITTKWVPVKLDDKESKCSLDSNITIIVGKSSIKVKPGFDSNQLTEVLKVLMSL